MSESEKLDKEKSSLANSERPSANTRKTLIFGGLIVTTIFFGLGLWAAIAPLAKAVSAPALLVVKGETKKIQHLEGGIVSELLVEEGEAVKKGQLLVRLDPVKAGATVSRFDNQLGQVLAEKARLEAELAGRDTIEFPDELLDAALLSETVMEIIFSEQRQFDARMATFQGQIAILNQRIDQLSKEISGYKILKQSRLDQLALFADELKGLRGLYEKGYYPKTKILAMERAVVQLNGDVGSDTAQVARAESAMGETKRQIISLKQQFRESITSDLRKTQADINDLRQQAIVAKDVLQRIDIRSPKTGLVQGLQIHTLGGIVRAGSVLMEVVPQNEELIVEAQVAPVDVDSVSVGQLAEVRLTALNLRSTPAVYGVVTSVSGDALNDNDNRIPYFLSKIELREEELAKLPKDIKLTPGMPAEVLIQTGERTALEYIVKPFSDALARGLNED